MVNKVILIGNAGKDPEAQEINNTKVVRLSLATNKKWKDKDGNQQEEVQWHTIVAWGSRAELVESYVRKGHRLYVEGYIQYREHEEKRYTNIIVEHVQLLTPKSQGKPVGGPPLGANTGDEDDLPF